jgi:hypothetical protein
MPVGLELVPEIRRLRGRGKRGQIRPGAGRRIGIEIEREGEWGNGELTSW